MTYYHKSDTIVLALTGVTHGYPVFYLMNSMVSITSKNFSSLYSTGTEGSNAL